MAGHQQHFRLKWNGFHSNLSDIFEKMLINENLVDCTVACDGASIKAHKLILSASSPYFHTLFLSNPCKHPIIILKDVKFSDLKSIINFIYKGEVNVPQIQLNSLLKTAETLKIRGLTEVGDKQNTFNQSLIESNAYRMKKRKRKQSKPQNLSNIESQDSSEEENRSENVLNNSILRFDKNSFNYITNNRRTINEKQNELQKVLENHNEVNVDKDKEMDEIEPSRLMEQSMSTPDHTTFDTEEQLVVVTPDVHLDHQNEDMSRSSIEEKFYPNFINFNEMSFDMNQQILQNNNQSPPQTIEEYERLLAEIQRKNLTTCPVCSKVFLKKSKLIRHYHTHFSNFRPKFSCVNCGKLFTTHDWCKRHQMSCNQKSAQMAIALI